jgi:MHS family proline/betaine transporter-like MFS transporter
MLLLVLVFHALFQVLSTGVIAPILAEMFQTRVRYTALSVSYGFAAVLFGGFAPLIATWLVSVVIASLLIVSPTASIEISRRSSRRRRLSAAAL